ncbi:MAG: TlpA family protein disulfide reductase [Acidobacteria bacterium]|nr:TlpA family protein disulfide reductase [Acidobacteriota bacterium]
MKNSLRVIFRSFMVLLILTATLSTTVDSQVAPQQSSKTGKQEDDSHAYAPLREVELEYKDFDFPTLKGERVRLSETIIGKKLVLVHYFSTWCHNSNYDLMTINELYHKYREQGFAVIGICEYSTRGELKKFITKNQPAYPICIEGEGKKDDRTGTTHFLYRQKANDTRLWGTPLNILLSDEDMKNEGEILTGRVRIATGELVKTEIEELIRQRLIK